jgi:hypothetical protein
MLYLYLIMWGLAVYGCWLSVRDWRGGPSLSTQHGHFLTLLLGQGAKTAGMAIVPIGSFMFVSLLSWGILFELSAQVDGDTAEVFSAIEDLLFVLILVLLALCVAVFLFMQPRFLVPPPLRGEHGYLVATWKGLRRKSNP